jgi:DNA processing protein
LPPGAGPTQWTFPSRNRLLAALRDGVLGVEGSLTSGAMQTAEQAAHLGRHVFAVPGSI